MIVLNKLLKKTAVLTLTFCMLGSSLVYANTENANQDLYEGYERVMTIAEEYGIPVNMTFEEYASNYSDEFGSYDEYADAYIKTLEEPTSTYIAGHDYYYNTGTDCPSEASYGKYKLTDTLMKGDIIYEAAGGGGLTGHIAIVEGIYTSDDGTEYVRLIEAISDGVVRSILDDTRYDEKDVTVFRVNGASSSDRRNAVNFCKSQLGKDYWLDWGKDSDEDQADWYCSELVWAAYYNQGYNLDVEVGDGGDIGVTPADIYDSNEVYTVRIRQY